MKMTTGLLVRLVACLTTTVAYPQGPIAVLPANSPLSAVNPAQANAQPAAPALQPAIPVVVQAVPVANPQIQPAIPAAQSNSSPIQPIVPAAQPAVPPVQPVIPAAPSALPIQPVIPVAQPPAIAASAEASPAPQSIEQSTSSTTLSSSSQTPSPSPSPEVQSSSLPPPKVAPCTDASAVTRKDWRDSTPEEKASYTRAVLCLAQQPSKLQHADTSLLDDFAWVHNQLNTRIHGVAQFLPWHRYFMHLHELALKSCGYVGAAMYWNWVLDSDAPASASVWSSTDGFGGNGTDSSDLFERCIDGPFSSLRPAYYGNTTRRHCVTRNFMPAHPEADMQEMLGSTYTQQVVDGVLASETFSTFYPALEGAPHVTVHAAIAGDGGDMGPLTSPNDPIFYLHHTQVDRIWWLWQQINPTRTFEYEGLEFDNVAASLEVNMAMLGLAPDRTVRDFMDTRGGTLCYQY